MPELHLSPLAEFIFMAGCLGLMFFCTRKGKENFAVCIGVMFALTISQVLDRAWASAAVFGVLAGAWIWLAVRARRRASARAERERRENEAVANSAGEPDNLPY